MKRIFVAIMALGALVSCSKDELVSVNRQAIQFGNAFVENSTRATSTTDPSYYTNGTDGYTQLTSFDVYGAVGGVNIFDAVTIEKTTGYGVAWNQTEGKTQYWIPGANYVFDAVVDATSVSTDTETGLPTSLSYTVSKQTDMMHNRVTTTGQPTTNDGVVTFAFTHLLSKVKFSVVNSTPATATNYRYVIKDAKLTNVYASGDYAVSGRTWSNLSPAADGTYALDVLTVASGATQYNEKEVLLIPGSAVGVSLTAVLEATVDGKNWTAVASYPKTFTAVLGNGKVLEANHAYNFILEVTVGQPIQFTATTLPDWDYDVNNDKNVDTSDNINL